MQTCSKCGIDTEHYTMKNKNKVDKNPKIAPIYYCCECISFANKLSTIFADAPGLRKVYSTVEKNQFLEEFKKKQRRCNKSRVDANLGCENVSYKRDRVC